MLLELVSNEWEGVAIMVSLWECCAFVRSVGLVYIPTSVGVQGSASCPQRVTEKRLIFKNIRPKPAIGQDTTSFNLHQHFRKDRVQKISRSRHGADRRTFRVTRISLRHHSNCRGFYHICTPNTFKY